MTLRRLLNSGVNSPASPPPPGLHHIDSDFVVILAALLCALICVLGLVAVARCAWIRRIADLTAADNTRPSALMANRGLKKKALNSLPKLTYAPPCSSNAAAGKFSADCAICLAEYAPGDEIRLLPQCGHVFHVLCVDTWLKSHSSCPSCREHIVAVDKAADKAARCQKCGELPGASSSATAATVTSVMASSRRDEINVFLP